MPCCFEARIISFSQGCREGASGGEGVAAREGRIADEDPVVRAPRDRFSQAVLGRRRTEREDRRRAPSGLCELCPLGHGAPAVRIELELEALANETTARPELHRLELRDLLDQHGDAHQCGIPRIPSGDAARDRLR